MSFRQNLQRVRRSLKRSQPARKPEKRSRRPEVESLESRTLLAAALYLDFGDDFPAAGLEMSVRELRDTFGAGGIQGPDLRGGTMTDSTRIRFTPFNNLITFDYNGDSRVDTADRTALRSAVMSLVSRYYYPFDVNVIEQSGTFGANSVGEIRSAMMASTNRDGYVLLARAVRTDTGASIGISNGWFGIAAEPDICRSNTRDDTALVFADNLLAAFPNADADTAVARTAAHEAGHNFGLGHTGSVTPGDMDMLTNSDLLTAGSTPAASIQRRNFGFFTRFPISSLDPVCPATVNPFDRLSSDPNVGLRPGARAYVTGTGAHDEIYLTWVSATQVNVAVNAYRNPDRTEIIRSYSYSVNPANGILVDAGYNNDRVWVDVRVDRVVQVRGMAGNDDLIVDTGGGRNITYWPDAVAVTGLDGRISHTGLMASGATSVFFSEFEPAGSINLTSFAGVTLHTPGTADNLTVSSPSATQYRVTGTMGTTALVPLTLNSVPNLTVNAGASDGAATADTVTVTGTPSGLTGTLTVTTGGGNDRINLQAKAPSTSVTVNGGTENDTITLGNAANQLYYLRGAQLTLDGGGGTDTLNVNDQGDTSPDTYMFGAFLAYVFTAEQGNVAVIYSGLEQFTVNMGSRADSAHVWNIPAGMTATLNGNGGGDTFNVGDSANSLSGILGAVAVNGHDDADVLNITDQADGAGRSYLLTSTYLERGTIRISYSSIGALTLTITNFNDAITVASTHYLTPVSLDARGGTNSLMAPNGATDWHITSANTGMLIGWWVEGPVSFRQVQHLIGGPANDSFKFWSGVATVSGTISAGGGINTLNYENMGIPVTVNLRLGSATGVGGSASGMIFNFQNAIGGRSHDLLVGDKYSNVLEGGPGNDVLIAGGDDTYALLNPDTLLGGTGEDILIAGWTAYDADAAALEAIRAAWASAEDYWVRIDKLYNGLGGLPALNESTVFYNYADGGNVLIGGDPEPDWFFADLGNLGPADTTDWDGGEWFVQMWW